MNKKIKLNCPMCDKQFITTRRDKIWCNLGCSNKFRKIKKSIDANYQKQKNIENKAYHYDFDLDKFFIKSLINNK
jgi:ribosomal protein L37AE/L43A|tara:strand:+ start:722 stop:946 length:225 start_codon:yes stop_codon:yes gene_type:complete